MKKNLLIAVWFTLVTTVMFGLLYPLAVTGLSQVLFPDRPTVSSSRSDGKIVGSRIIGQAFTGPGYFHSRPSSAGTGYDATVQRRIKLGPTNKILIERVNGDVQKLQAENPGAPVPVDLVTSSGSGLDPDISPAAAEFQIPRVSRARHVSEGDLRMLVARHTLGRQFGFLRRTASECSRAESGARRSASRAIRMRICVASDFQGEQLSRINWPFSKTSCSP